MSTDQHLTGYSMTDKEEIEGIPSQPESGDSEPSAALADLLARVEKTEGSDPAIDLDLWCATADLHQLSITQAPFTRSLDAALALVERVLPEAFRHVSEQQDDPNPNVDRCWLATVSNYVKHEDGTVSFAGAFEGDAKTAALAVLAAMLKALIAKAEGRE